MLPGARTLDDLPSGIHAAREGASLLRAEAGGAGISGAGEMDDVPPGIHATRPRAPPAGDSDQRGAGVRDHHPAAGAARTGGVTTAGVLSKRGWD